MASRITQDVRSAPIATGAAGGAARVTQAVRASIIDEGTPKAGGAARVTQAVRASIIDEGTPKAGGAARVTQVVRIVIATVPRRRINILTAPPGRIQRRLP